jgi:hypothetical protein
MNRRELFRDVLNEGAASEFEEAVLQKTIGAARRARRVRVASRCAVVLALAIGALFQFSPRREIAVVSGPVESKIPAPSHDILKTEAFGGIIHTEKTATDRLLATRAESVLILKTGAADPGKLEFISDEQLLAFFAGKAVALVHRGPHNAELVFLPEESNP